MRLEKEKSKFSSEQSAAQHSALYNGFENNKTVKNYLAIAIERKSTGQKFFWWSDLGLVIPTGQTG